MFDKLTKPGNELEVCAIEVNDLLESSWLDEFIKSLETLMLELWT
jgi:hypothetical protein